MPESGSFLLGLFVLPEMRQLCLDIGLLDTGLLLEMPADQQKVEKQRNQDLESNIGQAHEHIGWMTLLSKYFNNQGVKQAGQKVANDKCPLPLGPGEGDPWLIYFIVQIKVNTTKDKTAQYIDWNGLGKGEKQIVRIIVAE